MLTTDFSGAYDYEKEEAEGVAEGMLADLASGYYRDRAEFEAAIEKELAHWRVVFKTEPDSMADFERYLMAALRAA